MLSVKEAIQMVLDEGQVTKYRIAKDIGVEPIVIDKVLQDKQKTLNKVCCRLLEENYKVEVGFDHINMETASFRQAELLSLFDLGYWYQTNAILPMEK